MKNEDTTITLMYLHESVDRAVAWDCTDTVEDFLLFNCIVDICEVNAGTASSFSDENVTVNKEERVKKMCGVNKRTIRACTYQ